MRSKTINRLAHLCLAFALAFTLAAPAREPAGVAVETSVAASIATPIKGSMTSEAVVDTTTTPKAIKVGPEPFAPWMKDTLALRSKSGYRPPVPEKLLFDIVWGGWSFRWVHAGQATMELSPTLTPEIIQFRSLAWCTDFFQSFYPVHDTVTSWIHVGGLYPLRFSKVLNEGSYHHRSHAIYDQASHRLTTEDTSFAIAPFTQDILSAFYLIRSQTFKVGESMELAAVSGKKAYRLKVICHRRESVEVPAGRFETLVIEPILKGDGLFRAKGTLLIWLTDDQRHLPVKMQSKIPVGSIRVELVQLPQP